MFRCSLLMKVLGIITLLLGSSFSGCHRVHSYNGCGPQSLEQSSYQEPSCRGPRLCVAFLLDNAFIDITSNKLDTFQYSLPVFLFCHFYFSFTCLDFVLSFLAFLAFFSSSTTSSSIRSASISLLPILANSSS